MGTTRYSKSNKSLNKKKLVVSYMPGEKCLQSSNPKTMSVLVSKYPSTMSDNWFEHILSLLH